MAQGLQLKQFVTYLSLMRCLRVTCSANITSIYFHKPSISNTSVENTMRISG